MVLKNNEGIVTANVQESFNIEYEFLKMTPEELSGYRAISSFSPTAEVCVHLHHFPHHRRLIHHHHHHLCP